MKNLPSFTILLGAVALMLPEFPFTASADLVAHCTFNNTLADTTGNHNGTLTGTATYVAGVVPSLQALQFDGISNYVTLANPISIKFGDTINDYSISAWIETTSGGPGVQEVIMCKINGSYWAAPGKQWLVENYDLYNDENGQGSFQADFLDAYGTQPNDGNWHHVVLTYSARNTPPFTWYLDTQPIAQGTAYSTGSPASWVCNPDATNEIVQVGARENANYKFTGAMDDLQIYDQPLSLTQVQYLFANPGANVPPDPSITTAPQTQNAPQGTNVTLTGVASGTAPFSYQWYFNGTNVITNATSASLTLTDVAINQSGAYTLVVSNSLGTVSKTANLVVYEPAVFNAQVYAGVQIWGTVGFPYELQASGVLPGTYPWQTLTNLTLPSSPYLWFDLQSSNVLTRFYQATAAP